MRGRVWSTWLLRETLEWGAAVVLLLALPWLHYRQVLGPQLGNVRQLREAFEQELQTLRPGNWEKWAGKAMARIQQAGEKRVPEEGEKMERVLSGRGMAVEKRAAIPGPAAAAAVPAPLQRRNILLRVPGVGPEDVMWTAVDEFYAAPYLFGGEDRFGVDCSALVQEVFARLGVGLPRTAQEQFDSHLGVYVGLSDLLPGDLVFFHTRTRPFISHVGIFLGQDEFLHAPRSGRRVEIAPLSGFYRKCFVAGKRILSDPFADFREEGG